MAIYWIIISFSIFSDCLERLRGGRLGGRRRYGFWRWGIWGCWGLVFNDLFILFCLLVILIYING